MRWRKLLDVALPAAQEAAGAQVEVALHAVQAHAAVLELAAIERVVVVVEVAERDPVAAVAEQAVAEPHLGGRHLLVAAADQNAVFRAVKERAVLVPHRGFVVVHGLVLDAHRRLALAVPGDAFVAGVRCPIVPEHDSLRLAVPNQHRVAAVADQPRAVGLRQDERLGEAIAARGEVHHAAAQRLGVVLVGLRRAVEDRLDGGSVIRHPIALGSQVTDIHPVRAWLPGQPGNLRFPPPAAVPTQNNNITPRKCRLIWKPPLRSAQ